MKKLFAILALVLGMVSCQTEPEGFDVVVGGEQDVMLSVSLPEGTRANSAEGFNLNELGDYKVRYILEISYPDNGNLIRDVQISESTSATFPVRLAPNRDYTFTVWADLVTATTVDKAEWYKTDLYYNTREGLDEIEVKVDKWTANTEARDAWTATKTVTYTSTNKNIGMTLTRPFAKVRVVATDIAEIRNFGIKPTNAKVEYLSDVYVGFNAVEGKVVETSNRGKSHAFNYADVDTYEDYETSNQLTVFTDYLFVPADGNIKFSLSVFDNEKADDLIKKNDFNTTIPVVANKVTTIKGNVLTEGGDVKVTVDGTLDEGETIHYVEASNAAELQEAINESTEDTVVVLSGDIVLGATPTTLATRSASNNSLTIAEGVTTVIDLNGKRISTVEQSEGKHYYAIYNYGNLTIKDSGENGAIVSRGIYNYGTMTLESGKIDACDANGGYAVKNYPNATFVMNGGSVVTSYEDGDAPGYGYDATTIRNDAGATATFNGGVVNNISNYTFAIDNAGTITVNGGTFTSVHSTVSTYGTMTINGGTFTCDGLEGITAHALVAWDGSETTINGGTFDGKDNYNGFNIDAGNGAVVNIYGGNFLPVHSGSLYGDGTINVMGGTFFDDPAKYLAEGYMATENNGIWTVRVAPVAKIGDTEYETFEAAVAAAKANDTITLLKDATLAAELTLPANITLNGNGKQIDGAIVAGGDLTFTGHTKVTSFSASYYDRVITIGEGACLEVTGTGRVSLAYGNTFNITGSIEDAKTADKAEIEPSLIIPAGISITGGSDATMNVTNAYVKIGSTTSKNSAANGTFTLNFTNSIAEFTNQLTFAEPTNSKTPTFNLNIKDSVLTTATKLCMAASGCKTVIDNSNVMIGTYIRNSGNLEIKNDSVVTGSTIQFGENGGNDGAISVDASSLTINASAAGHALDGKSEGSITATNGAKVSVTYYKDMTINVDATSTFTGTDIYGNRKIHYVSEEMKLEPTNPDALGGATIVSNVWDKTTGKGVITFDRDLTTIGDKAFQRVTNATPSNWATSITLPASVKSIGDYAFAQCYSLTTIIIPDGVTTIGQYAFQSCDAVQSVTIGSGVSTIGSGAFYNCYEIKEFNCKSTTPPALADKWVFNGVEKTATVYVPAASVDTYKNAEFWSIFTNIVGK